MRIYPGQKYILVNLKGDPQDKKNQQNTLLQTFAETIAVIFAGLNAFRPTTHVKFSLNCRALNVKLLKTSKQKIYRI